MNYELWLSATPSFKIKDFDMPAEFRPRVGDIINLQNEPLTTYKVLECSPTNNPDNVKVIYYVQKLDTNTIPGQDTNLTQFNDPNVFYPRVYCNFY